jgi:hypothetical protein
MAASRWAAMARRRAVQVGVQDRLGGHLKELHPCGRLALMLAGRQDGPALQDTAAALGNQAQHLVLAGAERGLHSPSGPEQDTAHHPSLRHPAWVTPPASHGNFTIRAAISRRAPGLYIWASARRWRLRESLG